MNSGEGSLTTTSVAAQVRAGPAAAAASLRVYLVIPGLGSGGAEISLAELLPGLLREGIAPVIICLHRRDDDREQAVRRLGCDVRYLSGGLIARVAAFRRMLQSERVDLVHTSLFEADLVGRLAAAGTGIPVLSSLVNTSYEPERLEDPNVSRGGLLATRLIDQWTARYLSDHFHAVTETVKWSAVRRLGLPADRITVVERGRTVERLGIPSLERRLAARRTLGLAASDHVIVTVGRQEYQKGHRYLLPAMESVARTHPRVVLLIVGREGHASAELAKLLSNSPARACIRLLGQRSDVPEILAASDLFVFPSLYEGTGGALIEAMGLGLPIVASSIDSLREVVDEGRNALLVDPRSSEEFAAAMRRLLDDPDLASAFGKRGLEIFQARFTIGRSAQRMASLYRHICSLGSRR